MVILLIAREPKGDGAALGAAKHIVSGKGKVMLTWIKSWVRRRARFAQAPSHAHDVGFGSKSGGLAAPADHPVLL
jgi:hypothetical protein